MRRMLPQGMAQGQSLRWRHRTAESAPPAQPSQPITGELQTPAQSVLQREDLSAGAKTLYRALCEWNEYVVCIDPGDLSSLVGVSEQKLYSCLHELTRAGVISSCLGNLVFF